MNVSSITTVGSIRFCSVSYTDDDAHRPLRHRFAAAALSLPWDRQTDGRTDGHGAVLGSNSITSFSCGFVMDLLSTRCEFVVDLLALKAVQQLHNKSRRWGSSVKS